MTPISMQGNMSQQVAGMLYNKGVSGQGKDHDKQEGSSATSETATSSSSLTDTASLNPTLMAYLFNLNSTSTTGTTSSTATTEDTLTTAIDEAFAQIDANGDGTITQTELEEAESSTGLSTEEIDTLYSQLDSSGTGITKSDFEETVTTAVEQGPPMPPPPPRREGISDASTELSSTIQSDLDQLVEDLTALSSSITSSGIIDESALTSADSTLTSLLQSLKEDLEQLVSDMGSTSTTSTESTDTTTSEVSDSTATSSTASASSTSIDMASLLRAIDSYLIASLKEQAPSLTPSVA